ncbi:MAG: hypothetical protein EOQ32_11330 [Mesorhizobium sp.]|nr:MAG: hypothetical protein EOQ32_11330 [Mesorhizobium sp.]
MSPCFERFTVSRKWRTALFVLTQFRTENRFTLFLELLCFNAIPDGKPLHTFPGIALFLTQFRTENRFTLFQELLWRRSRSDRGSSPWSRP